MISRRRALAPVAIALAAAVTMGGLKPASAAAATGPALGTVNAISVTCDPFGNRIDSYVNVSPSPGYTKQRIWFQFAIYDDSRSQPVANHWPGAWFYLDYQKFWPNGRIENSVGSKTFSDYLYDGRFSVWVNFAFENSTGTAATYTGWIKATPSTIGGLSYRCDL